MLNVCHLNTFLFSISYSCNILYGVSIISSVHYWLSYTTIFDTALLDDGDVRLSDSRELSGPKWTVKIMVMCNEMLAIFSHLYAVFYVSITSILDCDVDWMSRQKWIMLISKNTIKRYQRKYVLFLGFFLITITAPVIVVMKFLCRISVMLIYV